MTKEAMSLKLEKPILDKAKEHAKKENRSLNNFIETVLLKYFEDVSTTKKPGE